MNHGRLRIAISGPAGAGKTTLVGALADALSLPVIEEGLLELHKAQLAFQHAFRAPPDAASEARKRAALAAWQDAHFTWCDEREQSYARQQSFIADRWELDIFGFWLHAFVQYETWDDTRRLRELFLRRAPDFDLVVMLPMGNFAVDTHNEVGLRRQAALNRSLMTQYNFNGMLSELPASVGIYAPLKVEPVEKRVADIVAIAGRLSGAS